MNENDYIKATNKVKISLALNIMREILDCDDCGISDDDYEKIISLLVEAENKIYLSFDIN